MWVQQLVLGGETSIDIEEHDAGGGWQPGGAPVKAPVVETYVVRTWRMYGEVPFKFLAIAGRDRTYVESLAWPLFEPRGDAAKGQ